MSEIDYDDDYIEQAFYLWYENGRKLGAHFREKLPEGKKPSTPTLNDWIVKYGWIERADALKAEISTKQEEKFIAERLEMFKRHAEIGNELIEKGMEFLHEKGITSDASAIRAIDLGLGTERISTGLADAVVRITKMSDEELQRELTKLLGRPKRNEDNIIDAEIPDISETTE